MLCTNYASSKNEHSLHFEILSISSLYVYNLTILFKVKGQYEKLKFDQFDNIHPDNRQQSTDLFRPNK